jgi:hypothetical protein
MFQKGDKVRLSEYGLNFIYPSLASRRYRDKAANTVFTVVGYSRDKRCTRVTAIGGSPKSSLSYHNSFLEKAS